MSVALGLTAKNNNNHNCNYKVLAIITVRSQTILYVVISQSSLKYIVLFLLVETKL